MHIKFTEKEFVLDGARINHNGQGTVYIAEPECDYSFAVIAVHGSGRGALDYKNTPFYAKQRDISIENGCLFATISNCSDTWGLDDGLYNLNLLVDYIVSNYHIKTKVALWATSAGGTLTNRMVIENSEKIELVIGTFPVYDLNAAFELNSCKKAWFDKSENPFDIPSFSHSLKTVNYYIAHGDNDDVVPLEKHSLKLSMDLRDNVFLEIIKGGEHSTDNYAFYGEAVEKAFDQIKKG